MSTALPGRRLRDHIAGMACSCPAALALLLALTGCGENANHGAVNAESLADPRTLPVPGMNASSGISAEYLAGPWCYLHYQAGRERSEEQIDYVFNEDGTLLYQNNPTTPVDRKGIWKLEDGQLSIGPSLWTVTTEIHSVEDGRLVLGNDSIQLVLARGACDREE